MFIIVKAAPTQSIKSFELFGEIVKASNENLNKNYIFTLCQKKLLNKLCKLINKKQLIFIPELITDASVAKL